MTESFLHYIWQFQYFSKIGLQTTDGEPLEILHPGIRNTDAGPDFSQARLKIGNLEWHGSVEIHIRSSGWLEHHHHLDAAYEPVVLHVVWEYDKPIYRADGTVLPALELKSRTDEAIWKKYRQLFTSPQTIACSASLPAVDGLIKVSAQEVMMAERLEKKAAAFTELLELCRQNWDEAVYQLMGRNFGFKVNAEPFAQLTRLVPLKILLRHANNVLQLEALLLGMAGMLDAVKTTRDNYVKLIQREFRLLAHKYQLTEKKMHPAQWRFMRLRPANFPTLRIAQFAALISTQPNLLAFILETDSLIELRNRLTVKQSAYWTRHYHFGKTVNRAPAPGRQSINTVIINTVIPVLAAYARAHDEQQYMDRALYFLQHLPAEKNSIVEQWKKTGWPAQSAFDSQSLLELYQHYCQKRRCLECRIGASLIRPR